MALERGVEVAVQGAQATASAGGFDGELTHQLGGDALAGDGDGLLVRGRERPVGEFFGMPARDPARAQDVRDQPPSAGATDFGRGDVASQQLLAGLGRRIDHALEPWVDRSQQVTQPADPPRLIGHQLATTADKQPDLGIQLAHGLDRS